MAAVQSSINKIKSHRAKSHTSIYDIFSPTKRNIASHSKHKDTCPFQEISGNPCKKYSEVRQSLQLCQTPYVTSEKYHSLNKRSSDKSVVRSTSTLFYDLDNLAKRHSHQCVADLSFSINNISLLSPKKSFTNNSGFDAKSNAIVQECATEFQPKLKARDSVSIISKKVKQSLQSNSQLSSDIFLNEYNEKDPKIQHAQFNEKEQKFWSYAKYRTEYTKPMSEERKTRIKNHSKHTENPCPCQLFSYACPCSDEKSLTTLAKNSKTVKVSNQVTSTMKISSCQKNKENKIRSYADKVISAKTSEKLPEYDVVRVTDQVSPETMYKNDIPNHISNEIKSNNSPKQKPYRRPRQVICPKCNEKIELVSLAEEEESLNISPTHQLQENSSPGQYSYASNISQRSKPDGDVCNHEPPCELVPVCQILPSEQVFINNTKCFKMESKMKNTARTIKITKACRHHPPCTVVPSCQRMRVLSNNCEFVPPCLHRPRCVNLPLCIPFSKTIDYDELLNKTANEEESTKCPHMYASPKYTPMYQNESVSNNIEHHFHAAHCEYANEYEPRFFLTPKMTHTSPAFTPYQTQSPMSCSCPKPNKSCQYECVDCKCNSTGTAKSNSGDVIVYIRDVGCQFRNKHNPQDNSIRSKTSSASFEEDPKIANYFTNYHTLRYEDKYTNPVSMGDEATVSTSSIEVDINCPSHGRERKQDRQELNTGFKPRASPVVANCSVEDPILEYCISSYKDLTKKGNRSRNHLNTVSSRKSFLKSKHKSSSSGRRRKKSCLSYRSFPNSNPKKTLFHEESL